ncbi:alanine--tRNA ligase [Mariniblastus fucicola]|uniref:Alanine--tRNA ligase n=1 Tax=Mariniblastus fucicola TaxID=980251 RepID=A0A5B9PHD1_9BACT|nr:alanine--tRNA ligase [Mariniblastus fucicola]QEG24122.1 Alanine--tRNA ligase [Mariniblastus fucicola]
MKTDEIRQRYLDFFKSKGHTVCTSDVLVPKWDPTVLFTPAGMNPFKDHFLGNVELEFTRATSSQKCLRTGDIENVGRTAYHHTFFEMLGNFSFGDYFKKDAIHWAWEFLVDKQWMGIDPERLTVTVYLDDDEASDIWHKEVGLPLDRIERLGEHDNFWPAGAPTDGPDGVCGPCSEIFFHPDDGPECEIWNLVFTQFNRSGDPPNNLSPLPSKNIDTGMGLERMAATLQGVETNFHIDSLLPIVHAAAEVCGIKYEANTDNGRRMRRITDHVRACTMAIHENVLPGKEKENYTVRRLLRRAVLQGYQIGLRDPFLAQLVPAVVDSLKVPYPELAQTVDSVQKAITNEENDFYHLIENNLRFVEQMIEDAKQSKATEIDAAEAARLFQTRGVPPELTSELAAEAELGFNWDNYQAEMARHGAASGTLVDGVMGNSGPIDEFKNKLKKTTFTGYDCTSGTATVLGIGDVETSLEEIDASNGQCVVVLSETPFYARSGGQESDFGTLTNDGVEFEVIDMEKTGDLFIHVGVVKSGKLKVGDEVTATVDPERRAAVCRAHSATHILHYALQQNLGEHATQRGSRVDDDKLRFDFANQGAIPSETLSAIETMTLEKISEGVDVKWETVSLDDAKKAGAMMLFGEKYPDPVRMVSIGGFSKELCGGTHLNNSSDVMAFEIVSESGTAAGTRRIEALTGKRAIENQQEVKAASQEVAKLLGVDASQVGSAVKGLFGEVRDLKKQAASGKANSKPNDTKLPAVNAKAGYLEIRNELFSAASLLNVPTSEISARVQSLLSEKQSLLEQIEKLAVAAELSADDLIAEGVQKGEVLVISKSLPLATPDLMRQLIDQIRKKTNPVAVFFATSPGPGKVMLIAGLSRDLVERGIKAGDWVKTVAPVVGGNGGGKPDLAQAGGKNPENIEQAIQEAVSFIESKI